MPKYVYPAMIFSLLGLFILFLVWSAFQASTQGTQVTDRDYYSKGLKYNSTMVEKRVASAMGWQLETQLLNNRLEIKLLDGDGRSVTGAQGLLTLYSRPDIDLLKLKLTEAAPGNYLVQFPDDLRGEINVRVELERDGARLNRQLLLNL